MTTVHSPRLSLILAAVFFLSSCGTRDYAPPPSDSRIKREEKTNPPSPDQAESHLPFATKEFSTGYLWGGLSWIGVPAEAIENFKCRLEDQPSVSEFKVLGLVIFGGAVLGVIVRYSGSWFLGKPVEPGPGHWFWNRLDQTIKTVSQGGMRGALLAGGCETLLAGGNFTPLAGILGQSFAALSGALTLGGMTSLAAVPYIKKWMNENPARLESALAEETGEPRGPSGGDRNWRNAVATLNEWSKTSDLGRGIRYRVAPGLTILGLGSGVGLVIYDWLQGDRRSKLKETACR